jgi:signal transduction histidine kinase
MDMFNYQDPNFTADKVKKYSKIMRQNCYRLLRLVNNLIDLNKLDAGFMNLNMDNYDIVSIVSQIVSSVADYVENKGISLYFETDTQSKVVACDPDKMERIILNLLSNAIKYTEAGGSIKVGLWDKGESLLISIKDDGAGIPREKQEIVFKRFMQVEKSLTRNHQGSGIGLALVKSLVELHGGKISLISEAGQGCEFIIELPVRQTAVREKNDVNLQ